MQVLGRSTMGWDLLEELLGVLARLEAIGGLFAPGFDPGFDPVTYA